MAPPKPESGTKAKMAILILLLVVLLIIVYAFASGKLAMGISGSFTYLIYIFLGLISSVVCYGLLSSMGEIQGHKYETTIKLGGAIVGLVVVGGGGLVYEKYVRKPDTIDMRVIFFTDNRAAPQKISGTATVFVANKEFNVSLKDEYTVLFQGLPSGAEGQALSLALDGADFDIDSAALKIAKVSSLSPVYIRLAARKSYQDAKTAAVQMGFNGGSAINYIKRPNDKNIVIQMDITSQSDLVIPLEKKAHFEVLSDSGVPMVSTDLESDNMILLNPNSTKEYYFEGFIPADRYEMVKGKTAVIKINYKDLTGKKQARTWQTEFNFKLDE